MSEMSWEVGFVAGEIWRFLSQNGKSAPIKIKATLGVSNTMLYLALGWLLREDKIIVNPTTEYSYKVSLKEP
jgi:predicted RNA-binding protein (virulence factor B family)